MTWQTILYFCSLLLTCAVTGWLAYYAWRQPFLPGLRAYAGLALCECLLALAEILSMLSGDQAQALFWWNVRFLFTALIPVFWVVFALQYQGRQHWLSRRLIAAAFIIPFITQVLLWSNFLPGLWVKQELSFYQSGLFWIANTSTRIPGLWFMVHSFYGLLLLLAGMALILLTAWRKPRWYRGQARLLSAGALVALIAALIPVFNFFPQLAFSPFTPAIGLSALLYALAIFRFKFLKRSPAKEPLPKISQLDLQGRRSLLYFLLIFLLLAAGISASGYITYNNYQESFRAQVAGQLSSIASLKISQLQTWRSDRLTDADIFYKNAAFSGLVQRFLLNPSNAQTQANLQSWLKIFDNDKQYDQVYLLDAAGVERLSASGALVSVDYPITQQESAVLSSRQVTFQDFYRNSAGGSIHLALLVPILASADNHPLGLLVLRIDPQVYLYPFIQLWPIPSSSAETLIVRRDGADVLFLNPVRFQANAALNLRVPLADTQVLAVKAALGQTGLVTGLDYRSVPVVGAVLAVPGSPWFLVARMDIAEVYAPLGAYLAQIIAFFAVLILAAGAGLLLIWRQQQVRSYRVQVQAAEALRASEENYRQLFEQAGDAIFIADGQGNYVDVNTSACRLLGYTRAEVLQLNMRDLVTPEDQLKTPLKLNELATGVNRISQRQMRRKDGDLIEVEISAQRLPDGRLLGMVRDITERISAENALRWQNDYLTALQETTLDLLSQLDTDSLLEKIVRRAGFLLGASSGFLFLLEPESGQLIPRVGTGALLESFKLPVQPGEGVAGIVWQTGQPLLVNDNDHLSGRISSFATGLITSIIGVPLLSGGRVLGVLGLGHEFAIQRSFEPGDVEILTHFARLSMIAIENARLFTAAQAELARRKRAEDELRQTSDYLENLLNYANAPIIVWDPAFTITKFNHAFERLTGYTAEEMLGKNLEILFPADSRDAALELIGQTLTGERWESVEIPILHRDGSVRIALWNSANLFAPGSGLLEATIAQGQDITERKQAEEKVKSYSEDLEIEVQQRTRQLSEAQEQLIRQERLAALGQLAGSVGHELRNPLGVISNAVYYLKFSQPDASDKVKEYLQIIENEVKNSDQFITELLDFVRVKTIARASLDVAEIIRQTLDRYALPPSVKLALDFPATLPPVFADPTHLIRVFGNLIENACQAMPAGGKLTLSAALQDSTISIKIQDTGIGIPPENMPKLFEPLFTTKTTGSGLGLSICQRLVEANGGTINVHSIVGQGSVFTVILPVDHLEVQ